MSHHPPLAAVHSEGREWILYQEAAIASKFRGSYLQIVPQGKTLNFLHGYMYGCPSNGFFGKVMHSDPSLQFDKLYSFLHA